MVALAQAIFRLPEIKKLDDAISFGGCPALISGVAPIHRAHIVSALMLSQERPVVVICADEMEAKRMSADISAFTEKNVSLLFSREFTFYNTEGVSRTQEHDRLSTMFAMLNGKAEVVVATADALLQRTIPPETLKRASISLRMGESYDMDRICEVLVTNGYSRAEQVEGTGQFARRGGIIDFWSPDMTEPCRCEFFGDEIDSMSYFDFQTQRRTEACDGCVILPSAETQPGLIESGTLADELNAMVRRISRRKIKNDELIGNLNADIDRLSGGRSLPSADKYIELIYPMAVAADYIPDDAMVFISDAARVAERLRNFVWAMEEDNKHLLETGVLESGLVRFVLQPEELFEKLENYPVIMADSITVSKYPIDPKTIVSVVSKQLPSYGGSMDTAASDIGHYRSEGYSTVILCRDENRAQVLNEFLRARGFAPALDYKLKKLPEAGQCTITLGLLSAGIEYPSASLAIITEGQLSDSTVLRRKKKKTVSNRQRLESYADLSPGDLVVHEHHGIGRFVGIFKLTVDGAEKDYIKIAFAGTDSLYVPATSLDLVSKYIGGGEDAPVKLSKMGGAEWQRTKSKAKGAAKEMAKELIKLYAERSRLKGHAFAPDSIWQTEFEERFGYTETDDQLRCIEEIKSDMEKPMPMDRLLCGDVGYGKTEVALRAAMKCILDGYQVAILVPTTVLAQQHYVTAMQRFAGYPVSVSVLSRFCTSAHIRETVRGIKEGTVDLVVGTHKLFQKDIKFKKLGLLIVDEEQRFGVTHKEKLKELAKQVDVLTLSATPIPRTMNMALSGIRDMSTLEEPPHDRQPVQTYVMEHEWGVLCDAMRREIARGGQIYYVHNRVENIERTAMKIREMLEINSVGVAHGKMDEDQLSEVMDKMASGELTVLVCTTIIETGIDIPNVNTLIIENADHFGLSQLHQLRGRVGRSPRRAYAYLTFQRGKILTEIAEKRLTAIREFAEFNSGFKIAMRDLEIRGAGNLLGAEQSGHMMSVGYDMYLKLLEEAVLEEKGEKVKKPAECSADISVSANIPERYVPSGEQRIDLYRRIAHIRTEEDSDEMIAELIDRYGDPPKEVVALISVALMRAEAAEIGITELTQKSGSIRMKMGDFDFDSISKLYSLPDYKGRVKIEAGTTPALTFKLKGSRPLDEALGFIRTLKTFRRKEEITG